jgi:hypothetical protein
MPTRVSLSFGVRLLVALVSLTAVPGAMVHAAPPDKDVTVENTEANPVIVRDVDNSARHFFQTSTGTLTNAFNPQGFGLTLTTVPTGQVLVIEYVSAACQGTSTLAPSNLRLSGPVAHFFVLTPTTFPGEGVASQLTRIYAGPLEKVNLTVFPTSNSATITCNVAISGYLVSQ